MNTAVLRKELQGYIANMPERSLYALKPLLTVLVEEPPYIIEPANEEECALIDEGMTEYYKDPASFIRLEDVK